MHAENWMEPWHRMPQVTPPQVPSHEAAQVPLQLTSSQVLTQVAGQVASQVGQPGHVQLV